MKKLTLIPALAISLFFVACKKEAPISTSQDPALDQMILNTAAPTGIGNNTGEYKPTSVKAVVSSYINDGVDESANLKSYVFEFRSDHSIIATNNGSMYYGRWQYSNPDIINFQFDFFVAPIDGINFLNADWKILEINKIDMLLSSMASTYSNGAPEKARFIRFQLL